MAGTTESWLEQRAAVERGKITKQRNDVLRRSANGRLLLELERCSAKYEHNLNRVRLKGLVSSLRYACDLADQAGVVHGWIADVPQFKLAFALTTGDVAFPTEDHKLCAEAFPRFAVRSENSDVIRRAIEAVLANREELAS